MISKCSICRHDIKWKDNPFRLVCLAKCQMIDLGTWASDQYLVPESLENPSFLFLDQREP